MNNLCRAHVNVMQTLICYLSYFKNEDPDKHNYIFKNIFIFQIMTVIVTLLE